MLLLSSHRRGSGATRLHSFSTTTVVLFLLLVILLLDGSHAFSSSSSSRCQKLQSVVPTVVPCAAPRASSHSLLRMSSSSSSDGSSSNDDLSNNGGGRRQRFRRICAVAAAKVRQVTIVPVRTYWARFRQLRPRSQFMVGLLLAVVSFWRGYQWQQMQHYTQQQGPPMEIAYSSFSKLIQDKETAPLVQDMQIGSDRILFRLQRPTTPATAEQLESLHLLARPPPARRLPRLLPPAKTPTPLPASSHIQAFTRRVDLSPELNAMLSKSALDYRAAPAPRTSPAVLALRGVVLAFYFVILWRMYGAIAGGMSGKNDPNNQAGQLATSSRIETVSFNDIQGMDEAKLQISEMVMTLRNPEVYAQYGARPPAGVLLDGPPGTGKTMLARATASSVGVPLLYCSGSEFVELYVGRGAARVRQLFQKAQKLAPCVIFIDEIDALGKSREGEGIFSGVGGRNDEAEQTLNQLLACMDGLDKSSGSTIVLAATNRRQVLDPALLRPGRFDRLVTVPLPDAVGRLQILKVHANKLPGFVEDEGIPNGNSNSTPDDPNAVAVDLWSLAKATDGCSGADLALLCNEAAIQAVRRVSSSTSTNDVVNHVCAADFAAALADFQASRRDSRPGWKWGNK